MKTIIYKVDSDNVETVLDDAASVIQQGGLVVFPTETVYGIGANALDPLAASKIYEVKGRPSDNPLIVHVASFDDVPTIAHINHPHIKALVEAFWPGPLTLVLPKKEMIPNDITGGLDTVAVRCPSNVLSREIIRRSNCPICAPSANISGTPSSTTFDHVYHDLFGKVDMIIDGGQTIVGLESTVLDLTSATPTVLRPGAVTQSMIEHVLKQHIVDASGGIHHKDIPKSPGMKYKHYAPSSDVIILKGSEDQIKQYITNLSGNFAILGSDELCNKLSDYLTISLGSKRNPSQIANQLFAALRRIDQYDIDTIYVEAFADKELGKAIMNRLLKAADNNIINL